MHFPLHSYSDFWGFPSLWDAHPPSSRLYVCDTNYRTSKTVCPSYAFKKVDGTAYLEIEIPGVEKEDISVETRSRKLLVVAKRFLDEKDKDGKKKLHREYRLDAKLSERTDISGIKADYRGLGILRLFIPLKGEDVRKITVHS